GAGIVAFGPAENSGVYPFFNHGLAIVVCVFTEVNDNDHPADDGNDGDENPNYFYTHGIVVLVVCRFDARPLPLGYRIRPTCTDNIILRFWSRILARGCNLRRSSDVQAQEHVPGY